MFKLQNKVAIITGASSGIGKGTALLLSKMGAKVVLIAKNNDKLKEVESVIPSKENVLSIACDVRKEENVIEAKNKIIDIFNKIDILITCAAGPASAKAMKDISIEEWRSTIDTDLTGTFLSCKIFGSCMIDKKYGRIVNLTSFHTIATYPERVPYNAVKSGVEGITRALAVEWGMYGITVNSVAPGPIKTPRTNWFLSQSPDIETQMKNRTPTGILGEVDDVAYLIAFLASDYSKHINGQNIVIDGGWTKSAWWGKYDKKY